MAIWRTSLGQTAVNAAATTVVAELAAGVLDSGMLDKRFAEKRDEVYDYLEALAVIDDAAYEGKADSKPAGKRSVSAPNTTRPAKTGGGRSSKGGSSVTLSDARNMELTWGAFQGLTLAALLEVDAETADDDYGYGDGERGGREYLSWLAGKGNNIEYVQRRARLVAEDEGIGFEE